MWEKNQDCIIYAFAQCIGVVLSTKVLKNILGWIYEQRTSCWWRERQTILPECKTGQLLFFFDRLLWNLQWFSILDNDKGNPIRWDYSLAEEFTKSLKCATTVALYNKVRTASQDLYLNFALCELTKSPFSLSFRLTAPCNVCGSSENALQTISKLWQWVLVLVT